MKKALFFLLLLTISIAGAKPLLGENAPNNLSHAISRQAAKHAPIYANERVKNMCSEWPGCSEWANKKGSFHIVDAEVERRVIGWTRQGAVWQHTFYVQTVENGQNKAYVFEQYRDGNRWTYPSASQIRKFPGHPNPNKPSKHIKQEESSTPQATCKWFTPCANWLKSGLGSIKRARFSQYAHFDRQGNAVWNRDLYTLAEIHFEEKILIFHSYQASPGGNWKHQATPIQAGGYPYVF